MTDLSQHNPTGRFSGLAEVYAKSRPTYPTDAIEFIVKHCKIGKESILVDVGAGTGISSRLMAAQGPTVIGIEPNDDMRSQAERESLDTENLSYLKGNAEETLLVDHIADVVLCAQAFHWFRADAALAEFKRILKPQGWVVLMWNERDESDTFTREYGDLLRELPDTASVEMPRGTAGEALLKSKRFTDQELRHFSNQQIMDEELLLGRAFSASYAPKEKYAVEIFSDKLRNLFRKCQKESKVSLLYRTSVYVGKAAE